ncbi:MAG TPA: hypothetical protein VHT03_01830 [Rhizomicrobium sp.]|jgi:hypothetical protein|nr:hypothetical protein [Rhizomicrobium sp.]
MGNDRAEQYRQRAHELRTIAEHWVDRQKQQTLLWLAKDYEKMADDVERQATGGAGIERHE